jgi:hypothetical protein
MLKCNNRCALYSALPDLDKFHFFVTFSDLIRHINQSTFQTFDTRTARTGVKCL